MVAARQVDRRRRQLGRPDDLLVSERVRLRDPGLRRARVQWIRACVARFGAEAVARWKGDPPAGWTYAAWLARRQHARRLRGLRGA